MVRKSNSPVPVPKNPAPKSPGLRRKGGYSVSYPPKSPGASRRRLPASPVVQRREPPGSPVRKEPPRSPVLVRREPLSCGSGSIKKQQVPISHYHPVTFNAVPSPPSVPFNPCVPQKKYASVRFNPSKERVIESLPASDCAEQSSVPPQPVNPAPPVAVSCSSTSRGRSSSKTGNSSCRA